MRLSEPQRRVRAEFAATLRILGRAGFKMGSADHITVVDPKLPERFRTNPFGVPLVAISPDDIVLIDSEGRVVSGEHDCKGTASRTPEYPLRPALRAIVHVHGLHTIAGSNLGLPVSALTTESAEIVSLQQAAWPKVLRFRPASPIPPPRS